MAPISSALADHLSGHHGVASLDTLLTHGLTPLRIRSLVRAGLLVREHQHVYRIRSSPQTFTARCVAACAAHPELVVTGLSAGRLWGLRRLPPPPGPGDDEVVTAVAPVQSAPSLVGVRVRRSNDIDDADRIVRPDGIVVASPARTWFDLATHLGDSAFESVTEQVLDQHCDVPALWGMRRRLAGRGRDGAARVNRVLAKRAQWQKPADSDLELRVLQGLAARGLDLVRQFELELRTGTVIHLDGADPFVRWGLEIDHVTWHGGRLDAQRDKARDRQARLVGWQVERVTDADVTADLPGVVAELLELHARRCQEHPRPR